MPNILVFGDSIVYGKGDTKGGWVQRLRLYLDGDIFGGGDARNDIDTYNLGVNGGTSQDILDRIESEIQPRLSHDKTVVIISIGLNDSQWVNSESKNRVLLDGSKQNVSEILDIAKSFTNHVVVLGLPSVDESKVAPMPWSPENSYLNEQIRKYNEVIQRVSEQRGVIFVDILGLTDNDNYRSHMLRDGVHPNDEGHELIFGIVKNTLAHNRII